MRLLIVNPNTSEGVTARIRAAAQAVALPTDRFVTVSAASGPALIVTDADAVAATRGVLETLRTHGEPVDGIVLASFGDTGAGAVRAAYPGLPVIGLAGAAFAAARALGGPVGIVTFGEALVPGLRAMAEHHGVADRLVGVAALAGPTGDPGTVQARHAQALGALVDRMAEDGATSVVLGGGPLAGLARDLAPKAPVPVIDGVQAAIGLVRSAARVESVAAHAPARIGADR